MSDVSSCRQRTKGTDQKLTVAAAAYICRLALCQMEIVSGDILAHYTQTCPNGTPIERLFLPPCKKRMRRRQDWPLLPESDRRCWIALPIRVPERFPKLVADSALCDAGIRFRSPRCGKDGDALVDRCGNENLPLKRSGVGPKYLRASAMVVA